MLGKLLKHEFKATARFFLPLFLAAVIMTPVTRFITSLDIFKGYLSIIPGTFTLMYVLVLVAIAVISGVLVIVRFYRNMVTDEGYLMHTLPVKPSQHIWSKTIVGCFWTMTSLAVILLSIFAFFVTPDRLIELKNFLNEGILLAQNELGSKFSLLIVEIITIIVISFITNIFYIYASIAIGQVISRHRIIGAFAAAIVLNIITQLISTVILVPIMLVSGMDVGSPSIMINAYLPITIIFSIVTTIAYFLITNYVMSKKLNLE